MATRKGYGRTMGTHAALGVTYPDGTHECVERSLQGDDLPALLRDYIGEFLAVGAETGSALGVIKRGERGIALDLMVTSGAFGGAVERGPGQVPGDVEKCDIGEASCGREHEASYYAHIDFARRIVGVSFPLWTRLPTKWRYEEQGDCPHTDA